MGHHILSAIYSIPRPVLSLVGYWPINEGGPATVALDLSGSGNNAAWQGTPQDSGSFYILNGVTSAYAGYLKSTGSNYLTLASTISFAAGADFTLCFWQYLNAAANNFQQIFLDTTTSDYVTYGGPAPANYLQLYTNGHNQVTSSTQASTGKWMFWAITRVGSSSAYAIYLNGVQDVTASGASATSHVNQFGINVGNHELNSLRVYTRVLSAAEIAALFTGRQ